MMDCLMIVSPTSDISEEEKTEILDYLEAGGKAMIFSDYTQYDLLIGMDQANLRNMHRMCGGDPEGKLHLLLDFTNRPGNVADPWYTGDFEATWRDVELGCQGLLQELAQE